MRITELEYVALMMMATRNSVLQCRFGPDWVALIDVPDNQWAIDAVKGKRS